MKLIKNLAKGLGIYFFISTILGAIGIVIFLAFMIYAGNGKRYEESAIKETKTILKSIKSEDYSVFNIEDEEITIIGTHSYSGKEEVTTETTTLDSDITDEIYKFIDAVDFFNAEYKQVDVYSTSGSVAIEYVEYLFTYEDKASKIVTFEFLGNPENRNFEIKWE